MSQKLGTLVIVVLKARNLHDKHSFYKQDVYACLSLNGTTHTTPVDVKGGQHPVWDAEIRLPVLRGSGEKYRTLEVSCWAKEKREDDLKGIGKVDISETLRTGEFDDWVGLDMNGAHRGDVYLEMTYYATAQVPLTRRPSKFNPSERLTRPPPSPPQKTTAHHPISSQGLSRSPKGSHLLPPPQSRSPSPSSSPRSRDHHLPPLPDEPRKPVPPILRPGYSQSPPVPVARASPPGPSHYPSEPPPDYSTLYPDHTDPSNSVSEIWRTPRTTPSPDRLPFPAPSAPGTLGYGDRDALPPPFGDSDLGLPDPYLASRYTAPIPLPSSPPSRVHVAPAGDRGPACRLRAPDNTQVLAAEEAARRRAQEDEDREIARQLDRELNLGTVEPPRRGEDGNGAEMGMPGGWW